MIIVATLLSLKTDLFIYLFLSFAVFSISVFTYLWKHTQNSHDRMPV